jgi:hypothetical protein
LLILWHHCFPLKAGAFLGGKHYTNIMNQITLDRSQTSFIRETLEDAIEYACDEMMISGEAAWIVVECLALAKQAELKGMLAPSN